MSAKDALTARTNAYKRLFDPENQDAQIVLADLMKFCRAVESTFHPDARLAAQLDGRREVWLRIQTQCKLSHDHLWALFGAPPTKG